MIQVHRNLKLTEEQEQEVADLVVLARESGLKPGRMVMVQELVDGRDRVWKVPATMTQGEARAYVGLVACSRDVETATLIVETLKRGVRVLERVSYPQG